MAPKLLFRFAYIVKAEAIAAESQIPNFVVIRLDVIEQGESFEVLELNSSPRVACCKSAPVRCAGKDVCFAGH